MASYRFTVTPCLSSIATLQGDADGEALTLWRFPGCPDCEVDSAVFAQERKAGVPTVLSEDNNPLVITLPGIYELRWDDLPPEDARVCVQEYERKCGEA